MTEESTVDHDTNSSLINGETENSLSPLSLSRKLFNVVDEILMNIFRVEMLLEISTDSIIDRQICNVLRKHFLEQRPIGWRPVKVELVVNTELTEDFFRKCLHFLPNGFFLSLCLFFPIRL